MWWTMTILTGRCMPLVGVQTPPSIVKATDMLHQPTLLPKRYTLPKLISSLDLDPEICYRSWRIRSIQYDLGDEASRNTRERMEGVELEIRRRYVVEWCLFHSIRCWSFSKLCQSLQLRSQICFHGWLHYFFCRFAPLPPRPSLLRQVLHHFNFKHQMLKSHRQKKAFPLSVWFPSSPFVPSHYNSHLTSTHFFLLKLHSTIVVQSVGCSTSACFSWKENAILGAGAEALSFFFLFFLGLFFLLYFHQVNPSFHLYHSHFVMQYCWSLHYVLLWVL